MQELHPFPDGTPGILSGVFYLYQQTPSTAPKHNAWNNRSWCHQTYLRRPYTHLFMTALPGLDDSPANIGRREAGRLNRIVKWSHKARQAWGSSGACTLFWD